MKYICIFCKAEDKEEVVRIAIENNTFGNNPNKYLKWPLSNNGEIPVTHWGCFFKVKDDSPLKDKLLSLQNLSIMGIHESPTKFFKIYNLVIIKWRSKK